MYAVAHTCYFSINFYAYVFFLHSAMYAVHLLKL